MEWLGIVDKRNQNKGDMMVFSVTGSVFKRLNLLRTCSCRLQSHKIENDKKRGFTNYWTMPISTFCCSYNIRFCRTNIQAKSRQGYENLNHRWKRSDLSVRGFAGVPNKYSIYGEKDIDEEKYTPEDSDGESQETPDDTSLSFTKESLEKSIPVGENVVESLETSFGMTREEAFRVIRSRKFFLVADAAILDTISCLADFGITAERIQRCPWLLLQTADDITERLNMVANKFLFDNYHEGLGFCYFGKYKIQYFQKIFEREAKDFPNHRNRIYCMAENLMVPVDHLTDEIVKVQRVLSMNFYRIETYIIMLNKYEIRREDILNDLWIFFNNMDLAEKRLQRIIKVGCKRPKLWMCRCPEDIFVKTERRYQLEKDALGDCSSVEEYLMKRLGCTKEDLVNQLEYNNSFQNVSAAKIQRIIDLLLSEGFTTKHILHSLRIIKYSEARTGERIRRLKNLGLGLFPLSILYKSPINFELFYDNFKRKKMKQS
ncbi:hypothetical protein SK128_017103 [Halocaridina rubra]|uniref:Uncharacterized protein n=1 Tax=Halocaridina rubra TaxID=373956 RepID=A0AAN8XAM4_HALRR